MPHFHLNDSQHSLLDRLAAVSGRSPAEVLDEALRAFAIDRAEREFWMKAQEVTLKSAWEHEDAERPTAEKLNQQLLANGLIAQLPDPAEDTDDDDVPIAINGEPLSETIVRERR
jgi:LPS O-antigen subunit length determinant protein (WzzB/FepE family)